MSAAGLARNRLQDEVRTPAEARERFRAGLRVPTVGWLPGNVQANLIVVPVEYAYDLLLFGHRNPKPCPVLDVTDVGGTGTDLAPGADLRTDLPAYRIWRDGELVDEVADATPYWRDDMVAFLIGCSFSFEGALAAAGLPPRNMVTGQNVPMYVTSVPCRPAGRVHGRMVVSMRPYRADQVARVVEITGRFPDTHGAPVHVGAPEEIGVDDLTRPDHGTPVELRDGELPLFWGCGVTPQVAVMDSQVPFAISHAPGHMFVTDRRDSDYQR